MANDVTIIVEASLGDALVKLGAAKEAVKALGAENERAAISADENSNSTNRLGRSMSFLTGNWKIMTPAAVSAGVALLAFTGNLSVLLPLLPVLTALLAGLIAPFTTLAAIMVAFIPPVTLIAGLLGSLGLAFVLAGFRAAKGGGDLSEFAKKLDTLKSMFQKTTDILAHLFLPYLDQLAGAAQKALQYIDQLAHMPLEQAFKSMSTKGVGMLTHFLEEVGKVIGKPIRLAFDIAFGPKGSTIRNSMLKIWTEIQAFFGKPPPGGGPSIQDEIANWFGRQDFTSVGMRWALELAGALVSGLGTALKNALGTRGGAMILGGAGAGTVIGAALGGPIGAAMGLAIGASAGIALNHYWPKITSTAKRVWTEVSTWAVAKFHQITTALEHFLGPTTWHNLARTAKATWDTIKAVAVANFHLIIAVAKEIWKVFDTLVIKSGAWKVALGLVKGIIYIIAAITAPIAEIIRNIVKRAVNLGSVFGGAVLSAINAVVSAVSSIIGAIKTAIGYAQTLASVLGSANPNQAVTDAGGTPGGRYGINTGGKGKQGSSLASNLAGGGVHVHHHTHVHLNGPMYGAGDAEWRRFAGKVGDEVQRRQRQRAGG